MLFLFMLNLQSAQAGASEHVVAVIEKHKIYVDALDRVTTVSQANRTITVENPRTIRVDV